MNTSIDQASSALPSNTRRNFLKFGAASSATVLFGFHLPAPAQSPLAAPSPAATDINSWIRITADNKVICEVAHSEMGQGSSTGLPMMLAEELECNWSDVSMEFASFQENLARNNVYGSFSTGGSRATRGSQELMRKAGATAREMLKAAAAQKWNVPIAECTAKAGHISHAASHRTATYGALAPDAAKLPMPKDVVLKTPAEWKIIGQPIARLDIPAKVNGSAIFGIDVKVPGMLYAAIVQCPVFGGAPLSVDDAGVKNRRGIKKIVKGPDFVAVVADSWWRAQQATKALKISWDYKGGEKLDDAGVLELLDLGIKAAKPLKQVGDVATVMAGSKHIIEAEYFTPYLNHATLEPQNCTARVDGDHAEIWVPTQNAESSVTAAAKTLGIPPINVKCNRPYLGGGFGRRGAYQDFVKQSVLIAKELPGVAVKLLWSREEDMQHGFYRPAALYRLRASFAEDGKLDALEIKAASQSLLETVRPAALKNGQDFQCGESFHDMPYQIANLDVKHGMCHINVPTGFWRSVFHSQNPFVRESFIDEICKAGKFDPLQFRLDLLPKGGRDYQILEAVAKASKWSSPLPAGHFRGLAVQDAYASYGAAVVEVSVAADKSVKVHQVFIAVDPGYVANADSGKAQIEGNVAYCFTAAFLSEITIKDGRVQQNNFGDYPITLLRNSPKITPILVPTGGKEWGGMGEPPFAALTPALANAIAAATGDRLRSMPFSKHGYSLA